MPSTVEDFWRMVTEHNICTMVQLNAPTQTATDRGYFYWAESDAPGSQITYGKKIESICTTIVNVSRMSPKLVQT